VPPSLLSYLSVFLSFSASQKKDSHPLLFSTGLQPEKLPITLPWGSLFLVFVVAAFITAAELDAVAKSAHQGSLLSCTL
jgi:hypothetical protein